MYMLTSLQGRIGEICFGWIASNAPTEHERVEMYVIEN